MAQHGYLREYDEGWDRDDREERDRGDWRERGDRGWRSSDRDDRDRSRGAMFRDDDRAHDREAGRDRGAWENNRDWPQRDRESGGRSFSSHPDDHYRSWRDQHMQSLDRDYQDYCREREQQFHRDFGSWRQNRQHGQGGSQAQSQGQGQRQGGSQNEEELLLSRRSETSGSPFPPNEPQAITDPMSAATLGTNNSETSGTGRGRR